MTTVLDEKEVVYSGTLLIKDGQEAKVGVQVQDVVMGISLTFVSTDGPWVVETTTASACQRLPLLYRVLANRFDDLLRPPMRFPVTIHVT